VKLRIGLLKYQPGWHTLLQQIGSPWKQLDASDDLRPESFSVIIINSPPTDLQSMALTSYVQNGGSLLAVNANEQFLFGGSISKKYFSSIPPINLSDYPPGEMLDIFMTGRTTTKDRTQSDLFSDRAHGKGAVICLPFDINALITDTRSRRKNFYSAPLRLPSEKVATVSKGTLRRLICDCLEFLHHRRGLPFPQKWHIPNGESSFFTFRVDSDGGGQEDVEQLYTLCKKFSIPTAWFLDTKSHETWLGRFAVFRDQEIGVHCYRHMTFGTLEENLSNFSKAKELLQSHGISPIGAASPYGKWNENVGKAFEKLAMPFSSEFSLDYDDLPFFPWIDGQESAVLQIPIHPICIGSMRRTLYSPDEMSSYFIHVAEKKISQREPVCFYHHPTHRMWDVLENVFHYLASKNIRSLSYSAYAAWWKKRNTAAATLEYDPSTDRLTVSSLNDKDIHWRISFPGDMEAITTLSEGMDSRSLQKVRRPSVYTAPPDIARARAFDWRHLVLNFLDSWYMRTQ
jgi:hypothetical protein